MKITACTQVHELRIITTEQGELVIPPHTDVVIDVPVIVDSGSGNGLNLEGRFVLKGYWDGRKLRLVSG